MYSVAIIGRSNVGKSSLFNKLCKKRKAIVSDEDGITRDRIQEMVSFKEKSFLLFDTGGIGFSGEMEDDIFSQAQVALHEADLILFVVDGQTGLNPYDEEIAQLLRKAEKKVIIVVNKIDYASLEAQSYEFQSLGFPEILTISCTHNIRIQALLSRITQDITESISKSEKLPKISLVGKPNVGKSTLLNLMLNKERSIVSPIPGTTRDTIDEIVVFNEKKYLMMDTAGIRRKAKEKQVVEKFASIRTQEAVESSDVCLLLLDAQEGMNAQEKKMLKRIEKEGRGCIILLNKWDLIKGFKMEHAIRDIQQMFPRFPVMVISAKEGRNVPKIFSLIDQVYEERQKKVSTPEINRFIGECMKRYQPPMIRGKRLKVYYATQVRTAPPVIALFVNFPTLMVRTYQTYLLSQIRKKFGFFGANLQLQVRAKTKKALA